MSKQTSNNPANNNNVPTQLGVGNTTSSGVTVYDSSSMNSNLPLPPSYDQAMGNAAASFATTTRTYTTTNGWNAPGIGAPNTGYNMPTTHTPTAYTTYASSVPPPQSQRNPPPQTSFVQQPPVVIIQLAITCDSCSTRKDRRKYLKPSHVTEQPMLSLGPEPVYITCPACHTQKLTRIEYEPSSRTHLMAALLCLVGLWCCVCLPYCAGSCMNTHHYCGNCGKFLGTYGNAL